MVIEVPYRAVTAMPGSENPRRSRGFTIESLIGTDLERDSKRESVCSQPAHHHSPLPPPPPPPPPPTTVGHITSNGTLQNPHLQIGTHALSSSSSSAASSPSSSSSSSLSSSSVSPNGSHHHHHHAGPGGPVTSTSLTPPSSVGSKKLLKCTPEHMSSYTSHHHGKNSITIINNSNYPSSHNNNNNINNNNNNSRSTNNNCTSSSHTNSSNSITSHSNNNNNNINNNNKITCNKQNSYDSPRRSPSPITSHISENERSNGSHSNINTTSTNSNDNNNNIYEIKSEDSPLNTRSLPVAHHHQYPQQQTPLGLVTHSIEKTLLTEDKERFSHHHTHPSQNPQQHNYHHHHSPPIAGSSPVGITGTAGNNTALHYPLKCVQNTEDYYRGTASGFTPVRLCNHPLGSAVTVAAAAAAAAAAGTPPTWTGVLPPTSPAAAAAAAAAAMGPVNMSLYRDPTLFNPWMFARCAGYLGHRYPVNHDGAFLLPPYRKPKRIRTAFSPAQLLQLEEAFEKNHYVVGQERKELAADLKLTETQVKVWFQNRRTKHKRMKAEEEATSASASTTREEPTSSSRTRPKEMDIDPTGIEPIEYDGSDENSDSELIRADT